MNKKTLVVQFYVGIFLALWSGLMALFGVGSVSFRIILLLLSVILIGTGRMKWKGKK